MISIILGGIGGAILGWFISAISTDKPVPALKNWKVGIVLIGYTMAIIAQRID